jgi:manganese/zinc/iron transport system substrate-binding protein
LLTSDIIFYSGLLLEGQMADILVKVSRKRPVYAVSEQLQQSYLIHDAASAHHDPHVWMDVQGWMQAVAVVADGMAEFDPVNADFYHNNAVAFQDRLQTLDDYARQSIASIPIGQRVLVTAHDAFNYMSRAYGIEVMGIQGLSTESEAGLKDINRLVSILVQRGIPAVFVETSVSDKNVKALIEGAASRGHQVVIGGELFSDAMGPPGTYEGTYEGMIDHNITVITRALGGQAPAGGMQGKLKAH